MGTGIWPAGKPMTTFDALMVSLTGIATVFFCLVALALFIVLMGKILEMLGLGAKSVNNKKSQSTSKSSVAGAVSGGAAAQVAPKEEDMEEYAVILAAVSEHCRTPIENLRINSITKK